MQPPYERLFRAILSGPLAPPADLATAVAALSAAGELPPPWETWTFIGLVRHRERQLWVGDVVRRHFGGDLGALARLGSFGHPAGQPQGGPVPGLPEWEFFFHGRGCCLTHRVTGECIDVDFDDDSGEYFDLWFYAAQYLRSLRRPEPPEQRLLELHPDGEAVGLAVHDLLAVGLLEPLPGREAHPFRLTEEALRHAEGVARFCEAWSDPGRRPRLAAQVGDWPAAHAAAREGGDPPLAALTAVRADACREARRQELLAALRCGDELRARDALHALADLGGAGLDPALEAVLRGRPWWPRRPISAG